MSYGTTTQTCFDAPLTMSIGFSGGRSRPTFPVEQPTKFDLVFNLTTAKALGLVVPDKLLALAGEVIE